MRTDEFADNLEAVDYTSEEKKASFFSGFLGPSKEQKRAQKEFDQWRKEFQEKSGETVSLPPEYLPSAWACLALFGTVTLHLLFYLLCHWLVSFKAMTLFNPAKKLDEACYILVVPPPNRGSAAMVAVAKSKITGNFQIEFQRQKYVYTPASRLGDSSKKYPNGVLTLYNYPVDLSLSQYLDSRGIVNDTELSKIEETWGKNHLAVAIPSFIELLKLQLLTPLSMFQVFTALLWLLDEYWSYTLFTLASVVVFEATTVFQRSRTQKMLGGMAPRPTPLYVFRGGKWTLVSTKDVLPGDLISLAYRKSNVKKKPAADVIAGKTEDPPKITTHNSDIIPCDCLLLKGSAVVNEASLTGNYVTTLSFSVK